MAISVSFAPLDTSGLADLPNIYEKARIAGAQRDILQTLDPSSPRSLDEHAARLFAAGDIEGGKLLTNESLQRRELARKTAYDQQYLAQLPAILSGMRGAPTIPGMPSASPGEPPPTGDLGGGVSAPASPFTAPSGQIPSTGAPPQSPQVGLPGRGASLPGVSFADMRSASEPLPPSLGAVDRMTPSEEIIAAAQGGPQGAPPRGPQYAQAGSPFDPGAAVPLVGGSALPSRQPAVTPGAGQAAMAQPLPNWLPTADLQVGQAGPVISGVPPPPKYQGLSVEQQAYKDAQYFTQMAAGIGRGNPGMAAQLRMYTQDALSRSKPTQERFDWNLENFDRLKMGEKDIPFSQWKADESGRGVTYAAAMERYKEASSASEKAQNLEGPTQVLKNVMSNPAYFSGSDVSTEGLAQGLSLVKNSKNALVSLGVPIPDWLSSRVDNATTGIQLREVAQSLNNAATLSRLGSLSKGVSEGDRRFAERIGTSNLNSVPGNQLILEYTQAMIDQQKGLGVIVDDLRSAKGGKLAPEDINRAVRSYNDDHPIAFDKSGKPINELGVRLQNLVNQQKESPGLSSDIKSGLQTVTDTASAAGRSIKTAVESAAAVPGNVAQTVAATTGNIAQANTGPAPAAEAYPQPVEPTFQPGLRRDPMAVGNQLVDLAYAKGGPNVGSMINLRQSVRPDQAPAMQAAITQKLGTGNSGEFDLTNWSTAYSSLGTKEKAGLYGGATPGSLRSNLEDIAKNTDAVNGLWRNVPGPQLAQALSNPAGASSVASWTRAYGIMQRAGMTPQAIARFKLATDNLNNNIGSNLVWSNFVQRGGR